MSRSAFKMSTGLIIALTMICSRIVVAAPSQSHFWLAAHHDWFGKRGYFLVLENFFEPGQSSKLNDLRLVLGVADGREFRYLRAEQPLSLDHDYAVRVVINANTAELWLDGKRVAQSSGGTFVPNDRLEANVIPSFLTGPAEYSVQQSSVKITSNGKTLIDKLFKNDNSAMLVWGPGDSIRQDLKVTAPIVVETKFKLVPAIDLKSASPVLDKYGQARAAKFPGKIESDAQLLATVGEEDKKLAEWGERKNLDKFGGSTDAGWKDKATGFFRTMQKNGKWWLISPEGNPTFYVGMCAAPDLLWPPTPVTGREFLFEYLPPKDGKFADCWAKEIWSDGDGQDYVSFHALNMMRKYEASGDWKKAATERTQHRAKVLGFGGYGKWSTASDVTTLPVIQRTGVPNLVKHPDIFDPAIQKKFRDVLAAAIEPRKNDPFVMGWSVGNEKDECILPEEITAILKMDDSVPAKKALTEFFLSKVDPSHPTGSPITPNDQQLEKLRGFYAQRYYSFIYKTVKDLDPNHLYFGFWPVPGYWVNENDWRWVAPYCDVIGYDFYSAGFADEPAGRLIQELKKPVLNGEFSHPPNYNGQRGYGSYPSATASEQEAGERYAAWLKAAATNPYCVGVFYFAYRDQPLTGRGPGKGPEVVHGEHYAFGLVDITDRPKWDFVSRVRDANSQVIKWRQSAKDTTTER